MERGIADAEGCGGEKSAASPLGLFHIYAGLSLPHTKMLIGVDLCGDRCGWVVSL